MKIHRFSLSAAVVAACLLAPSLAGACNVPVFRYALEKWLPGPYEAVAFHKGSLTADQKEAMRMLRSAAFADPQTSNIWVESVDMTGDVSKDHQSLIKYMNGIADPQLVVRYPVSSRIDMPFLVVPLTKANAKALLQSAARKKIADRILKGTSAVWVFLKSGDKEKDDAVTKLLDEKLRHLERTLKLPELTESPDDKLDAKKLPLTLKFSSISLDRNDASERVFIEMLLMSEPGLKDDPRYNKEPMVFPVFGRGRALYALVGKGINEDNLIDAAKFLTGPCTCTVKDKNPGIDLLMTAPWSSILGDGVFDKNELPPLFPPANKTPRRRYRKNPTVSASLVRSQIQVVASLMPCSLSIKSTEMNLREQLVRSLQRTPEVDPESVERAIAKNSIGIDVIDPHTGLATDNATLPEASAEAPNGESPTKVDDSTEQRVRGEITQNTVIAVTAGVLAIVGVFLLSRFRSSSRS